MNQTIRSRIEQIKRGEIPEGYEKTPFGIFPCDWEKDKSFKELFSFFGGLGKSREELGTNGVCYLHYGDMHTGNFTKVSYAQYLDKPKYEIKINGEESFLMNDGDIAFLDASEDLEGTSRAVLIDNPENRPFIAGLHTILAKEKQKMLSKNYKQYISMPQYVRKQFQRLAVGFKVYGLNRETFNKVKISFPKSKSEQEKIAEILQEQDRLIELKEKLIEEKKKRKQYLVQQLLTKKLRLPGISEEWRNITLGECLQEVNLRTTENNQYEVLSVTREGIVRQKEQFNFQRASDNNIGYKVIKKNQVAFSVLNLWMGSVDILQSPEIGMISPAYKVFDCISNIIIPDFAKYFLRSAEMVWLYNVNSEIGASIVRKNLDLDGLLQSNVTIPKIPEQRAIAEVLSKADDELDLLQKELEEQKRKKQSLMQLLLTGIVKVKA